MYLYEDKGVVFNSYERKEVCKIIRQLSSFYLRYDMYKLCISGLDQA